MQNYKNYSMRFLSDTRGSISALMGTSLVLVAIFGGMAIDMGRWTHSQKTTQDALDAAVLAGARWLSVNPNDNAGAIEVARNYYQENVRARLNLIVDTVDFVVEDGSMAVSATGEAALATTLMKIAGIEALPLFNSTQAGLSKASIATGGSNIEVSVMLDVTGSMCDDGYGPCTSSVKLDGLKAASKKLVEMVVSEDQSEVTSKVALVPFSTRIRLGQNGDGGTIMKAVTNLDPTWSGWYNTCVQSSGGGGSEGNGNWSCSHWEAQWKQDWKIMPCVTDRFYNSGWQFDLTDDAPGPDRWLNAHGGGRTPFYPDSSDSNPTANPSGTHSNPVGHWTYNKHGTCSNIDEPNEVMPLSTDRSALLARLDGLKAYGATAGAQGTAWAWYTMSPKWAGSVWSGDATPAPYSDLTEVLESGAPKMRKVAVLMTDGVYNTYRGWKGQDKSWMSDTAKQMCENMKAEGIEIYTVGLALDELSAADRAIAEDTLSSCGTDIEHFYNTLSVDELVQAFEDIGSSLKRVSLTR